MRKEGGRGVGSEVEITVFVLPRTISSPCESSSSLTFGTPSSSSSDSESCQEIREKGRKIGRDKGN